MQDVALAVGLSVLALLPLGVPALELGELPRSVSGLPETGLTLMQTLPLVFLRRAPALALAVIGTTWALAQLVGADTGLAGLALLIALYAAGRHQSAGRRRTIVIGTVGYACSVLVLVLAGSPERPLAWGTFWVVLAAPWCAGAVGRAARERQVGRERLLAQQAVSDARTAIARDLHDVVTHHVTAMVLHAESTVFATDHLADDERSRALSAVGASGRSALQDLRALLDALDPESVDGAVRRPADIAALVARLRDTGYPVALTAPQDLRLPPATAAVVHDVAREALTNAMRHAPGESVAVRLTCTAGGVELRVENAIPTTTPHSDARGGGRGQEIMATRVATLGGSIRSGVVEGGATTRPAWRTTVRLPPGSHQDEGRNAS